MISAPVTAFAVVPTASASYRAAILCFGPSEKSRDVRVKSAMRRMANSAPFAQTTRPSRSSRGELAEHRVTSRTELASDLPLVSGHRRQLQQVISNLVQNAIEAMDNATDRDRILRVRTGLHNRDAIIVAVENSGPGLIRNSWGAYF